jgi:hypothetical protein
MLAECKRGKEQTASIKQLLQTLYQPLLLKQQFGTLPMRAAFYIKGPRPKGWHLGQKQVPRFCTRTRSMMLPQMGQGSPPL